VVGAAVGGRGRDRARAYRGQQLVGAGELVVDVPAKLVARARLLGVGSARRTDRSDAASVAAVALHHRRLRQVAVKDHTRALRLLTDHRDDLVAERTRTLSRLHVLLGDLQPGGAERNLTAQRAAALLGWLRPVARVDRERKRIARELLADVRRLDQRITAATTAIGEAVTASGTTLTTVFGLGPVLAPRSSGTPATSPTSPTVTTSPAPPAPPPSKPPAGRCAAIG
jgi:transposase